MIEEGYVSFDVAKLMKEKGFEQKCRKYYIDGTMYEHTHGEVIPKDAEVYECPTYQMAIRWLREVHGINIEINCVSHNRTFDYGIFIWQFEWRAKTHDCTDRFGRGDKRYLTYEEAEEKALWHALSFLCGIPFEHNIVALADTYPLDLPTSPIFKEGQYIKPKGETSRPPLEIRTRYDGDYVFPLGLHLSFDMQDKWEVVNKED